MDLARIACELRPFSETRESREFLTFMGSTFIITDVNRDAVLQTLESEILQMLESEIHTNEFRDPVLIVFYAAILAVRGEFDLALGNLRIASKELIESQALKGPHVTALFQHVVSETNRQENSRGYETYTEDRTRLGRKRPKNR